MIPFIRSFSELMAITKSREIQNDDFGKVQIDNWAEDSVQHKRKRKALSETKVELPDLPKSISNKWIKKKEKLSRFFVELDYNNQIQASYDITLQERLNNNIYEDAA